MVCSVCEADVWTSAVLLLLTEITQRTLHCSLLWTIIHSPPSDTNSTVNPALFTAYGQVHSPPSDTHSTVNPALFTAYGQVHSPPSDTHSTVNPALFTAYGQVHSPPSDTNSTVNPALFTAYGQAHSPPSDINATVNPAPPFTAWNTNSYLVWGQPVLQTDITYTVTCMAHHQGHKHSPGVGPTCPSGRHYTLTLAWLTAQDTNTHLLVWGQHPSPQPPPLQACFLAVGTCYKHHCCHHDHCCNHHHHHHCHHHGCHHHHCYDYHHHHCRHHHHHCRHHHCYDYHHHHCHHHHHHHCHHHHCYDYHHHHCHHHHSHHHHVVIIIISNISCLTITIPVIINMQDL